MIFCLFKTFFRTLDNLEPNFMKWLNHTSSKSWFDYHDEILETNCYCNFGQSLRGEENRPNQTTNRNRIDRILLITFENKKTMR